MPDPLSDLFRHAQKMQRDMARLQEDLKERVVEGTAGGGAVTVQASGQQELLRLTLKKEIVEAGDLDMLQDLIVAAANQALKKARDLAQKEIQKATGGMLPPGMF